MVETRFVEACGKRLKVLLYPGETLEEPLVLLHEGLGAVSMWRDFPQQLVKATGRSVWAWDRWGYGESSPLLSKEADQGYLDYEAKEMLPATLDALGIERAHFFGHSDGGTIALLFASVYGHRVASIVAQACHLYVDELTIHGIQMARNAYDKGTLKGKLLKHHGENTDLCFNRWANTWLSAEHLSWNISKEVEAVTAPVLAIQGDFDQYGTWGQVEAILSHVKGAVSYKVEGCRHMPHLEKEAEVVSVISKFLRSIQAP